MGRWSKKAKELLFESPLTFIPPWISLHYVKNIQLDLVFEPFVLQLGPRFRSGGLLMVDPYSMALYAVAPCMDDGTGNAQRTLSEILLSHEVEVVDFDKDKDLLLYKNMKNATTGMLCVDVKSLGTPKLLQFSLTPKKGYKPVQYLAKRLVENIEDVLFASFETYPEEKERFKEHREDYIKSLK